MSSSRDVRALRAAIAGALLSAAAGMVAAADAYPGVGRPATPTEIAAWDIDVRPDFQGLPKGSGSVAQGQDVWESRCASCHGVFGESNEVFSPLVGGTTAEDVKTGRVARLRDPAFPGRTTLMKVATVSTLWDYVNRAMPWNAPKSLKTDEVYAVVAYLLNLGGVLPDDFVLSDTTMAQAQARLPNRHGMTLDHALWAGRGLATAKAPDVRATACMNDCVTEAKVASLLPDHARNNHGNLADQNRLVGAQRGVDTTRPPGQPAVAVTGASGTGAPSTGATGTGATGSGAAAPGAAQPAPKPAGPSAQALLGKHGCVACHGVGNKIVGPALRDVARKHGARPDAVAYLTQKIRAGGTGVWGAIPMPAQTLPEADAQLIARWLADGARP